MKQQMAVRPTVQSRLINPAPFAMVWEAPGAPHQAVAVPGVSLAAGDVLVQVEMTTICGSDIHTALGHRPASAPLVLGHEQVGHVVAVGSDVGSEAEAAVRCVDGTRLEVGDRVVWSVTVSCGECDRCTRGLTQKCRLLKKYGHERMERGWELSGGFASHVHLRAGTSIVHVDRGVPAHVAASAGGATATAAAAVSAAREIVEPAGEVVLVSGAGLIGLTITAMLTDIGARVIVADPNPARRRLAHRFGAVEVVDPSQSATARGGLLTAMDAATDGDGPLIVIETSGSCAGVATAIDTVAIGGVVVLIGSVFPSPPVSVDAESVVRRHVTVRGVHDYSASDLRTAVRYLAERQRAYPFDEVVGVTYALADVDAALIAAASGEHVRVGLAATV